MVPLDKKTARQLGQARRNLLSAKDRQLYSQIIQEKALTLLQGKKKVALYISMGNEVDTSFLLKQKDLDLYVPRVENGTLHFYPYCSKQLGKSDFGVLEPIPGKEVSIADMDVVLVPLSAFDCHGNRCGYGKGYYDCVLKEAKLKIGLAFQAQEVDFIACESQDIPLDDVLTESY